MSQKLINLAMRFFWELTALYTFGCWGWNQRTDFWRYFLMIGLRLLQRRCEAYSARLVIPEQTVMQLLQYMAG